MPESTFRELADNAPVMIWRAGPDKLCDWFNKPWLEFVGRQMHQEVAFGWAEGVHPDDLDRCLAIYTTAFDARENFSMPYRLRRHDGVYRWLLDNGKPFKRNGEFAGYFGTCFDVTEQREAHDLIIEALAQRDAMLAQRDVLVREVYHRVKNNLQQIEGLIAIEGVALTDQSAKRALNALSGRVRAMGSVHAKLMQSEDMTRISAHHFITDLCADIARSQGATRRKIQLVVEADAGDLDIEQAVTFGLLINELVTNAFKHAFPSGREGCVRVRYNRGQSSGVSLEVVDDGIGLSDESMSAADRTHSGFRLIEGFAEQLHGKVTVANADGTSVRVALP